jgi:DNA-binding IclR family transcriptional regulator
MAILDGTEAILIAKQETLRGNRLASWVGKRMDMHTTGIGKAMLAYLPKAEVDMIVEKRGLARHNENTISNLRRLHEELDYVVKMGYALDNEEDELGVRCLGVPILGPDGRPLAAISVAGSAEEIPFENLPHLANDLRHAAKMLSQEVVESLLPAWPAVSIESMAAQRPSRFGGEEVPSLS